MTTIKEMNLHNPEKTTANDIKVEKIEDPKLESVAFAIRRQVFVEEQNVSQERESMNDAEAIHYLATVNGLPAGAARYRIMDKGAKIERIAVLNLYRGKKVGEAILKKILEDLKGEKNIYLYAQVNASAFYVKNGFEPTKNYFLDAGIEHVEMVFVK